MTLLYVVFAFLLGFAVALTVTGRVPLRFLRPLGRLLRAPFRPIARLLRRSNVIRTRARTTHTATEGSTVAERGLYVRTEVDAALHASEEAAPDGKSVAYDFKEENKILRREGWPFKSIHVPATYLPSHLVGPLTDEITSFYEVEARKFFAVPVQQQANRLSLYEDAEGAFIISLFRSVDRRCYYVLNEMRKTINGNARTIVVTFTGLVAAWALAALFAIASLKDSLASVVVAMAFNVLTCGVVCGAMVFLQNTGYKQHQRHNARELRLFLIQYLGRIADRFRESTGNAKQVTVGDEKDAKKLYQTAQKWHKIMVWTPFRTFYIECFVRSVRYQIDRNCGYYLLIPYSAAPLLIICLGAIVWGYFDALAATTAQLVNLGIFSLLLAIIVYVYFNRILAVVIGDELSRLDYLGYHNLNVSAAMDEVVGKYAEDIGFWKGRRTL